jgi:translation initiation factor 3 subunit H
MMRCLRDVNIDHNAVGWYQSTYLGSYVDQALIQTQFSYQQNIPQSVIIIYGAFATTIMSFELIFI